MKRIKSFFNNPIVCIVSGAICLLLALLFAPMWNFWENCPWKDWGMNILHIIIALLIVCYLVFYLVKKVKTSKRQVIRVLTIIEFVLLSLVAIGCIFTQAKLINVDSACQIFGLAIWIRGTVELFRAYYYKSDAKTEKYPIWQLVLAIVMVTLGTYCFAKPFIQNIAILWIFVAIIALFGAFLLVVGITSKKSKK